MISPFDERIMKQCIIIFLTVLTVSFYGCAVPHDLQSVDDYERYYTGTRWYWSKYQSTPSELTEFKVRDNQGMQAFLTSASGTDIIYSELEPSNFMKSFQGIGKLKELPNVTEAIFERDCDYTQRHPKTILLVGFVDGRAIQIEASHSSNTNRLEIMLEAISVARQVYQQLSTRQPANRETSNN